MFVSPKIALHYPGWQLKIHNWNFILFLNFFFPLDVKHISENISMGSIFDVPFFCCSRLHHIFLQPWEYFSLKVFFRQFFFSLEFLHLIEHFESHKCHSSLYVHEKTAHTQYRTNANANTSYHFDCKVFPLSTNSWMNIADWK